MYSTLISATALQQLTASGQPLQVFDCSFDLMNPDAGRQQFEAQHLPGAVYVHLDEHLSDKTGPDRASGGRHPLPSRETFAARLQALGLSNDQQVVVMERQGASQCGRLWWMLKWCGHEAVAVLDGGLAAWQAAGGALASGPSPAVAAPQRFELKPALASVLGAQDIARQLGHADVTVIDGGLAAWQAAGGELASGPSPAVVAPQRFELKPALVSVLGAQDIARRLGHADVTVIDARAAARFRGEVEPLDPVAGHIPGALNRPFVDNMAPDGRFKPAAELRADFERVLAGRNPASVVHQCGSGVSAIPNLLAMEIAGLGRTALFPGSWSEWCNTPGLPCAHSQVSAGTADN